MSIPNMVCQPRPASGITSCVSGWLGRRREATPLDSPLHAKVSRHFRTGRCSSDSHLAHNLVHDVRPQIYILQRDSFIVTVDTGEVGVRQLERHEAVTWDA